MKKDRGALGWNLPQMCRALIPQKNALGSIHPLAVMR
jgi:hypothetical protein